MILFSQHTIKITTPFTEINSRLNGSEIHSKNVQHFSSQKLPAIIPTKSPKSLSYLVCFYMFFHFLELLEAVLHCRLFFRQISDQYQLSYKLIWSPVTKTRTIKHSNIQSCISLDKILPKTLETSLFIKRPHHLTPTTLTTYKQH